MKIWRKSANSFTFDLNGFIIRGRQISGINCCGNIDCKKSTKSAFSLLTVQGVRPYNPAINEGGAPLATTSLAPMIPQERRRISENLP